MHVSKVAINALLFALASFSMTGCADQGDQDSRPLIRQGISEQQGTGVPEVSTQELETILREESAVVLDTRPHLEWSISHIPGAINVAPKPGVSIALYTSDVAEVGRVVGDDKSKPLVLYCNGPNCGKSKRVAGELLEAGYTSVRRYQLGAPVWRALVGVMVIEPQGIQYVLDNDQTAVWIDVRDALEFDGGSIRGARNLPRSLVLPGKDVGEVFAAKNDGRLPMQDHNTRIIVFGKDGEQAREVVEALAREAFQNVTFFAGSYEELRALIEE